MAGYFIKDAPPFPTTPKKGRDRLEGAPAWALRKEKKWGGGGRSYEVRVLIAESRQMHWGDCEFHKRVMSASKNGLVSNVWRRVGRPHRCPPNLLISGAPQVARCPQSIQFNLQNWDFLCWKSRKFFWEFSILSPSIPSSGISSTLLWGEHSGPTKQQKSGPKTLVLNFPPISGRARSTSIYQSDIKLHYKLDIPIEYLSVERPRLSSELQPGLRSALPSSSCRVHC